MAKGQGAANPTTRRCDRITRRLRPPAGNCRPNHGEGAGRLLSPVPPARLTLVRVSIPQHRGFSKRAEGTQCQADVITLLRNERVPSPGHGSSPLSTDRIRFNATGVQRAPVADAARC